MDIFSLYNSLPGFANMAGQAAGGIGSLFQSEEDRKRDARTRSAIAARERANRVSPRGMTGIDQAMSNAYKMFGPAAQGSKLQSLANQAMRANAAELASRKRILADERERKHELEMLLLRLQAMNG